MEIFAMAFGAETQEETHNVVWSVPGGSKLIFCMASVIRTSKSVKYGLKSSDLKKNIKG